MEISGIYLIRSKKNPKRCYIGSAVNIMMRWMRHLKDLRIGKHHSIKLQRHYLKYGEADFQFSVLSGCDKDELINVEQFYIDAYKPYFNTCLIAGSQLGLKRSDETKKRMSGRKPSDETRKKMSEKLMGHKINLGRRHSLEHNKKISESKKGKKRTLDEKKKISNGRKGKGKGLIHLQYIKDNIGKKTQEKIAKELGIHQSTVSKILKRCA